MSVSSQNTIKRASRSVNRRVYISRIEENHGIMHSAEHALGLHFDPRDSCCCRSLAKSWPHSGPSGWSGADFIRTCFTLLIDGRISVDGRRSHSVALSSASLVLGCLGSGPPAPGSVVGCRRRLVNYLGIQPSLCHPPSRRIPLREPRYRSETRRKAPAKNVDRDMGRISACPYSRYL